MTSEHVPPRPDALYRASAPPPSETVDGLDARPKATWSVWEAVAVYVLAIILGGLATVPFFRLIEDEDLRNITSTLAAAVVIVGVVLAWLSTGHPTWRRVMGFPRRGEWWPHVRASIGFGLLLYPGMVFGVGLVIGLILSALSGEQAQAPEQVPAELSAVGLVVTVLYAVVIAPVHEELFFRGVLFRGARDRHGLGVGLVASGVAFALIHYLEGPWQDTLLLMGVMLFNGIALAWWYERRGTVAAPLIAHVVFNVIGLSLILTIG
jgi:membrane protease YdiL (CAAX protease family)